MAKKKAIDADEIESETVSFFMEDAMFYALWKYAQPKLDPAVEYTDFEKFAPISYAPRLFEFISANLKKAGVLLRMTMTES